MFALNEYQDSLIFSLNVTPPAITTATHPGENMTPWTGPDSLRS